MNIKTAKISFPIIIVFVACFYTKESKAQFAEGDRLLNLGLGVSTHYSGGIPVSITYEQQAIDPNLSVGGIVGFLSHSSSFNGTGYSYNVFLFGARGSYHFNELLSKAANLNMKNIDLYAGAGLAYQTINWNSPSPIGKSSNYDNRLRLLFHIGGRYYFTNTIAAYLELGDVGASTMQVGIAFKF